MEIFMARSIAAMATPGPNGSSEIEFVLFDLGGVLIDPGGVGPLRALSGIGSDEELWARWLGCPWVRRFEAGSCSAEEFASGFIEDWGLALTAASFLEEFGRWPGTEFTGASELVAQVREAVPVGFLSNANAYQWHARFGGLALTSSSAFDYRFLSFELGLVKPDPEIFAVVAARLPAPKGRVLFLDDNLVNVDAAAAGGFAARRVQGPREARAALVEAGVLAR
jgi:putative hydrolase of the HAD superfamily